MKSYIEKYNELYKNNDFNDEFKLCSKVVKIYEQIELLKKEKQEYLILFKKDDIKDEVDIIDDKINLLLDEFNELKNNKIQSILLEIKPGVGVKESGLFMIDLLCMYVRFCEKLNIKVELLEQSDKEIIIRLFTNKFDLFKYESGNHRVQRVSKTENKGRVHTSSVLVLINPEYSKEEFIISDNDLRIDKMRSSGPGGQNVNKVESAIRITHIPTGITAQCQDEKSQHSNLENAKSILFQRVKNYFNKIENDKISKNKKEKLGSGDRSEKTRTYNFPKNRVTDHILNKKVNLDLILSGNLNELVG